MPANSMKPLLCALFLPELHEASSERYDKHRRVQHNRAKPAVIAVGIAARRDTGGATDVVAQDVEGIGPPPAGAEPAIEQSHRSGVDREKTRADADEA